MFDKKICYTINERLGGVIMTCSQHKTNLCVQKVPFFNHLQTKEMLEITKISKHKTFKKGEIIYYAEDPLNYLYIVHIGKVKMYQLFESGKEQLLRLLEQGEFFGEFALFKEKSLDVYVEALEETNICMIERDRMQELMQEHPMIAIKILEQFSSRLEAADQLIGSLSAKDVESRLATYLLQQYKKENNLLITLPVTKKDLASYLATSQETLSRRMTDFERKGIIEQINRRQIRIVNVSSLKIIAEEV